MNIKLKYPFGFLYFVSFIFSMQYGLVLYINSSFLELSVGEKIVGIIFTIASLLSILVLLEMPRVLTRFGNYRTTIFFVLLSALSLIIMGTVGSSYIVIPWFFLFTITSFCLLFSLDVFIENFTLEGRTGQTRGLFLTIRNLAILLSPLLSLWIVAKASYSSVYLSAGFFVLVSLFFIVPHLKKFKDPIYRRISVHETFKKIFRDVDLKKIYACEFFLNFFYSWMIIYMPIYLHQYALVSWEKIGLIFTIMLIPFVVVDYPLGRISDAIGEKKILTGGFAIISFFTGLVFFIHSQSVLLWALVLFATRVGAASIEIMCESYFFKIIGPADAGLIGVFRNMFPLAFIISPLVATLIFLLVPAFPYLFLILTAVMICGFLISLRIRDVR